MPNLVRSFARRALGAWVSRYGYKLVPNGTAPVGYTTFLANCKQAGLAPATVFDVGVGEGTPWLYAAFPNVKFVLFEALEEFETNMREICATRNAEYHLTALGARTGSAEIQVPAVATGASLKSRTDDWSARVSEDVVQRVRTVSISTLDNYESSYEGPFVLKLDVEGFEREVIEGASQALARTDLVIAEASVIPRHADDSTLQALVIQLAALEFDLLDIVEIAQTGLGGIVAFVDVAFARRGSDFQYRYRRLCTS